jgi:hypothetical protein
MERNLNMALFAMAAPILPGKTEQWRRFKEELKGPRYSEYVESRRRMGVRERAFLQSTPQGDIAIITWEGEDAEKALRHFAESDDPFTRWFLQQVKEIHGLDLSQPVPGGVPEMVVDTDQEGMRRAA